jgi:hypothetical protein
VLRIAEWVHSRRFVHRLAKSCKYSAKKLHIPVKIHREFIGLCENAGKRAQIRALREGQTCREVGANEHGKECFAPLSRKKERK